MKRWYTLLVAALLADMLLVFVYAPVEAHQGFVQKIFYVHVPSAMAMYIGFGVGTVASIVYLIRRELFWDALAVSAIEVGLLFCTIVLVTGPIWAKPIWGGWWTWDPRLTTTFFLWLIFAAYFLLRSAIVDPVKSRLYSAVLAVFGSLDIPVVIFAVKLWRGMHPAVLGNRDSMPTEMRVTLIASMSVIMILAITFIHARYRVERRRHGSR